MVKYAIVYAEKPLGEVSPRHRMRGPDAVPGWVLDVIPEAKLRGMTDEKLTAGQRQPNWKALRNVELTDDEARALKAHHKRVDTATRSFVDLPEIDENGDELWTREVDLFGLTEEQTNDLRDFAGMHAFNFDTLSYSDRKEAAEAYFALRARGADPVRLARAAMTQRPTADKVDAFMTKLVVPEVLEVTR